MKYIPEIHWLQRAFLDVGKQLADHILYHGFSVALVSFLYNTQTIPHICDGNRSFILNYKSLRGRDHGSIPERLRPKHLLEYIV